MEFNYVPLLLFMKLKVSFASLLIFCSILIIIIQGVLTSSSSDVTTINIGVILDLSSRMGKEQETAMRIAIDDLNKTNFMISTDFIDYNQSILQTAIAAEALVKQKRVEVIILGIDSWEITSLVAKIGALFQVPIISLASSSPISSPFHSLQWPFLVQLSHNATQQVQNIASIIKSYHWRRVILVYEDVASSGTITLLTETLQNIGTKIEHHVVLPPFVSTTKKTRRAAIRKEMKLVDEDFYSRVFIVLKISLPYVRLLFEEAKEMGLMRNQSVWITTEAITNFFPSFENFTMSNMEGVIGIMTKFDNSTSDFEVFEANFGIKFRANYENEIYHEPSYQALLSYDAINIIVKAKNGVVSNTSDDHNSKSKSFLKDILQTKFTGLSGQVSFNQDQNVAQNVRTKLVNIVGANYNDVLDFTSDDKEDNSSSKQLASEVKWPGNLKGDVSPKGWKMPTYTNKMRIGVPIAHNYKNFIDYHGNTLNNNVVFPSRAALVSIHNSDFSGYCIGIFDKVVKLLGYELPYQLIPFNSSYDDLVNHVYNKTFDAAVGDMTIMANRTEIVDFTLPFAESGLSIVLPVEKSYNSHGPWIFLKPFTTTMWVVTFFVFIYTMIIIWVLEHGENSDFRGSWDRQLSATVWFAFNSLYFAQRERISSKLARVVVIMWLFIVLILTQSYTANLTSMITNERLNQSRIDIEMLQRTKAKVGYDNSSFVAKFLEELLRFDPINVVGLEGKFEDFHQEFQDKKISAAYLEYLYAKLFLSMYCNQYIMTQPKYRFGGFGFVFAKGSPIVDDVSEAILRLTENDTLKTLEKDNLKIRPECTCSTPDGDEVDDAPSKNDGQQSSLSLASFRILFYMSGATTTACLLASLFIPLYNKYRKRVKGQSAISPDVDDS